MDGHPPDVVYPDIPQDHAPNAPNTRRQAMDNYTPNVAHSDVAQDDAPKRRKTAGGSNRGVASLTPEQLAKKRANDREAQRNIRERTRNHTETLERKVADLESKLAARPDMEQVQQLIRDKDQLLLENMDLKRRLGVVLETLQPLLNKPGSAEIARAACENAQLALVQQYPQHLKDSVVSQAYQTPLSLTAFNNDYPTNQNGYQDLTSASEHRSVDVSYTIDASRVKVSPQSDVNQKNVFNNMKNAYSPYIPDSSSPSRVRPVWTTMPRHCPPTCPLDTILLSFLEARKTEVARGETATYASAAVNPSIASLLNPVTDHSRPERIGGAKPVSDNLSQLMSDIISKFPHIALLPDQVATAYMMFMIMRWQIYPTKENYERIPVWLRPTQTQLSAPHPAWMDNINWPELRDRVIPVYDRYPIENWFLPFTNGLSVNWPYKDNDCLIPGPGGPILNAVFETHIRQLENWSLGPEFTRAYPELADVCRIQERRNTQSSANIVHSSVDPIMSMPIPTHLLGQQNQDGIRLNGHNNNSPVG